ncbi:alpha-amylase family glycosyl hydrolase [Melioribacter sp. Ez-97]|uniref:alpha-amylase family glycosyl hydrolase n=1 Tax=Melioribacter sp. Ez-97 TaxID=3423434 RepID=UPI003ED9D2A4
MKCFNGRKILILKLLLLSFIIINAQEKKPVVPQFKPPEWTKNVVMYEVNVRQYTPEGTFKAFEEHLPRLNKMGVDILWFMPIHPIGEKNRKGSLGSYYSIKDYKAINPEYGTEEDFKHLVNKAHEMGFYVMLDWVANHTSWDNVWTESHPEFFSKNEKGEFYPPVPDWHDVIDLDFSNKELWNYMIDAMKYWVSEFDVDGFRCDYANGVPIEFWTAARKELEKVKPLFMLAEAAEPEMHIAFDMTYNWQLKDIMNKIAAGELNAAALTNHILTEKKEYPKEGYRLNFTTNHDENSWSGTVFERLGESAEMFSVLTTTIHGMPLFYSGQEAGLNKRLRFFEKDTIDWSNPVFEDLFTKLCELKEKNKAVWSGLYGGEVILIENSNPENIFSFYREKDGYRLIAFFNASPKEQKFSFKSGSLAGAYKNYFTSEEFTLKTDNTLTLKPWEYIILVNK